MTAPGPGRLEGKVALITGAGQGIGRACAIAFAAEGARVVATSRTASKMSDLPATDARIEPAALDVTDASAVERLVATVGQVDVLVNCAGQVPVGTILDVDPDAWAEAFEQNVTSIYSTTRAVLPGMVARRAGSIINVASVVSSIAGVPGRAAYGATKAAVIGLTKAVAADCIRDGVRCNALCPGTTQSPSLDGRIAANDDPEAARRAFVERQPMGRLGTPEELAAAAVWLAADESAFVTGTEVVVDGGQTL